MAAVAALRAAPSRADFPSALVLGTGYAAGPSQWTPWENLPALDDSLWIFGTVAGVNAPFVDLLPAGNYEITYVFDSYTCTFAAHGGDLICIVAEIAIFGFGSLHIYLDTSPDADLANAASFRDGELVLEAAAHPLQLFMEESCVTGIRYVQRAAMQFSGGTWFSRVSQNGVGFTAGDLGAFRGDVPAGIAALGYVGQSTSHIDILTPNMVTPTTWGRIKALYH